MLFGLFKRTKIKSWEIELLQNVLTKIPHSQSLLGQINEDLFRGVLVNMSDIPGYIAFTYNHNTLKKYENKNEKNFKITNIKIFDQKTSSFLIYTIYISDGVINGYSIAGPKKFKIDVNKIDTANFQRVYSDNLDFNQISNILSPLEKELINPSEVYLLELDGKEYYHIMDLEDGNFIGIDIEKNVYRITHDPMEIVIINSDLKDILTNN